MKPGQPLESFSSRSRCKQVTLLISGLSLLVLSAVPLFIDPLLAYARFSLRIAKGSLVYDMLSKEIPGALVEAYVFNITNGEKFLLGEDQRLKVKEIGPFTYQEYRSNENFFMDGEAGTMTYTPRIITRFHPELSFADPKKINVSVANIPLLTMGSTMGNYPYWTQVGFNMLASRLNSQPIINLRAHDFMWGYDEPLIALGYTLMPGWINFKDLGMMDRLYDQTVRDTLVVGATDGDKFRLKSVNGEGGMQSKGYADPDKRSRCNTFVDTYEGIAYPPGLTPETQLRLYRNVFCRILDLQYVGSKDLDYIPGAYVYRFSNTTFRKNSENKCLCRNVCVDGMSDLSSCFYGFGVSLSQAHFYDVNPKIYDRIEGMEPDYEKHGSEFIVDPNLGSVLNTRVTLQLNLVVENANSNVRTKPFSHMIIPVLYFKIIQPELADDVKASFRKMYFVWIPYIIPAIQVILFIVAVSLLTWVSKSVRFIGVCKELLILNSKTKKEKSPPVYAQQPLMEKNCNSMSQIISSNLNVVDGFGVA